MKGRETLSFAISATVLWYMLLHPKPTDSALVWWVAAIGAPINTAGLAWALWGWR